ncbi:hypothetical protein B0H13DRAFT_1023962 [Mycena leptocephala]|nr:hypothetical protein B0H13DRAFT_1023962 [Mycena leptocephala]
MSRDPSWAPLSYCRSLQASFLPYPYGNPNSKVMHYLSQIGNMMISPFFIPFVNLDAKRTRLREMDVRTNECERQLKVTERERDQWEGKVREAKYRTAKAELDEFVSQMEGL